MKHLMILLAFLTSFTLQAQEICNNGIDDDADGFVDCEDPDCHDEAECYKPFICNPDAFLFQNSVTDVYKLTVASGVSELMVDNLVDGERMNGIGFNVKDGCIWGGVPTELGTVGRVDSTYTTTFYPIAGLPLKKFYVGDVDTSGVLFLYHSNQLHQVDVNPFSGTYLTLQSSIACSPGNIHDFVFNPVNRQLYSVRKNTNELIKIDPATGTVTDYGVIPELEGHNSAFGAIYSDLLGNIFISTNKTGKIWRVNQVHNIAVNADIDCSLFALGPYSGQNDGCMCSLTLVPLEICSNGTDDDGDGLIDCMDPACWEHLYCTEQCGDGLDNDGDGLIDMDDPDVDADGDGVCVDVDPDDNDACNPSPSVGCLEGVCGTNIAAQGTATQSSTEQNSTSKWGPDNALDGNTSGTQNNMILTAFDYNSWWELDLGQEEQLDEFRIWNRTDSNTDRLEQFYVFVSSSPFASTDLATTVADGNVTSTYVPNAPDAFVILQPGITGRYIRVQLLNQNNLHMTEFEVIQYSDASDPEYNTLGSWDNHGVPNYLEDEENGLVSADLMEDLNYMFGYGNDLYTTWPYISQEASERHIHVETATCLNLTMIASALSQDEALAYYTYPIGTPPTSLDPCDLTIVTPNLGSEAFSNGLEQGDVIELGEFDANTAVGFVILHQAWNGTTNNLDDPQYTFSSRYQLNPETAFPDHIMAVKDDVREMIHFAVEGGLTPEISVSDTDKDFADLFFSVEACNYENLDLEDMAGCLYTTIGCNSVPTGLTVTDIGLWRGTLEWDDLVGSDSFRIRFREYASGDDWEYRNMGTDTSYLISQYNASIKPGTMYEWQVASTCEGTQTGNSVMNIFETRYPCEMPSSSWVSDITSTSVRVNWTAVNYATTYKIAYYETGNELETEWRNAGNQTYFDITGLGPGTEYNYRAGAYCDEFPSCMHPYLHAITFNTLGAGMEPPTGAVTCVDPRSEVGFEETDSFDLGSEDLQMQWYYTASGDQLLMTAPLSGGSVLNLTALNDVSFGGSQQLTTLEPFNTFDVGNMDGSGGSEVLVSQIAGNTASVYGIDGGEFRRQARTTQHSDAGFAGSVFAQLDSDPALELVAINSNVNKLQVFEPQLIDGREGQTLTYRYVLGERLIAYESPMQLQAFDLNGDGLQEIGVSHLQEQFLTVHYNGEAADSLHFTKIPCALEGPATGMIMGMMDSDADRDMAIISAQGRTLEIYSQVLEAHGPGIGKQTLVHLDHTPSWVRMIDVDANGRQDVIVGYSDAAGMTIFQSLSNGEIMLDEGTFIPLPTLSTDALAKDLDNDSRQDLIVACADGTLRIFHNTTYSPTELAVVTQKQTSEGWNANVIDSDKEANYHWEYWNGEQFMPLHNSNEIRGAQSTTLGLPGTEEMVVRCVETKPCGASRKSAPLVSGASSDYWKVVLSPNPAKASTHLRTLHDVYGSVRLEIMSLGGRVVYSETITHSQGPVMRELPLNTLAPGTYLIRVSNRTGSGVERLVIEP